MPQIYISLGSNIDREYYIKQALHALAKVFSQPLEQLTLSSLFESQAIGFDGAAFYNMVVGVQCSQNVEEVTTILRAIEFANGREINAKKFSSRSLDLDLLLFDDLVIEQPAQLPRDEITQNAFVLWPLSQIAPDLIHPKVQKNYRDLWRDYNKKSQQLSIVANCW